MAEVNCIEVEFKNLVFRIIFFQLDGKSAGSMKVAPGSFIYTADPSTNAGAYGNSYIQFVTWDDAGPVAEGILTYGQSSNPASSHFNDQTRKYAAGEWVKLPFTDAQIKADPNFKQVQITE